MHRSLRYALGMAAAGAVALAPTAAASAAAVHPMTTSGTSCSTWISGQWGHARCYNNNTYSVWATIHVECDAFYDPNVDRRVLLSGKSSTEMQGECWSSVDWVTANTYR